MDETAIGPRGRIYRGGRVRGAGASVTVDFVPLRHVVFHSTNGFAWGYAGSGPADLALSILGDHLGCSEQLQKYVRAADLMAEQRIRERHPAVARAFDLHQAFKIHFLSRLEQGAPFAITSEEIDAWLDGQPK